MYSTLRIYCYLSFPKNLECKDRCINRILTSPLLLSWLVLCSESLLSRLLLSFGDRAQSTQCKHVTAKNVKSQLRYILFLYRTKKEETNL